MKGSNRRAARLARLAEQAHPRLLRRPSRFAVVASLARRYHVLPLVLAAAHAGLDVIDGEVARRRRAAVLTVIPVADENLAPGEPPDGQRPAHLVDKADHGGKLEGLLRGVDDAHAVLQQLGLALPQQHDGAADGTHVQWLVVLVQQEHRCLGRRPPTAIPCWKRFRVHPEAAILSESFRRGVLYHARTENGTNCNPWAGPST